MSENNPGIEFIRKLENGLSIFISGFDLEELKELKRMTQGCDHTQINELIEERENNVRT